MESIDFVDGPTASEGLSVNSTQVHIKLRQKAGLQAKLIWLTSSPAGNTGRLAVDCGERRSGLDRLLKMPIRLLLQEAGALGRTRLGPCRLFVLETCELTQPDGMSQAGCSQA